MVDPDITLYNYPLSPCGEKVRFALMEKGLPFRLVDIDLSRKANLAPDYLRLNPKGFVPTLVVGNDVLNESTVINEYLDEVFPDVPLKAATPGARAEMRLWTKLVDETVHPAWPAIAWPILVRPSWLEQPAETVAAMLDKLPDPARRERQRRMLRDGVASPDSRAALSMVEGLCDRMAEALADRPWLTGDRFTLADLALLPYFFALDAFGMRAVFDRRQSLVRDWYDRAAARPAYRPGLRSHFAADRLAIVARLGAEAWAIIEAG
ncbi:MAG: glutathione S-transferase family protein [Ferrovibrionaceae bacterium]